MFLPKWLLPAVVSGKPTFRTLYCDPLRVCLTPAAPFFLQNRSLNRLRFPRRILVPFAAPLVRCSLMPSWSTLCSQVVSACPTSWVTSGNFSVSYWLLQTRLVLLVVYLRITVSAELQFVNSRCRTPLCCNRVHLPLPRDAYFRFV